VPAVVLDVVERTFGTDRLPANAEALDQYAMSKFQTTRYWIDATMSGSTHS
jgi:hypothetical protein